MRGVRIVPGVLATLSATLVGCGAPPAAGAPVEAGVVVEVVDGDTVVLSLAGRTERVRLLGIDTPETVHPTKPIECHGPEASALLARLLPIGAAVGVARDRQARDPFDRLLLYLLDAEGRIVNEELIRRGAGTVLVIEPNGVLADRLRRAESAARAEGAGLWGACGGPGRPAPTEGAGPAVPLPP
jgi:micrococcal nuclease